MNANRRHRHQKAKTEIYLTSENTSAADAATENFADLLAESFGENTNIEGSVVRGFVIGMEGDAVIIDVGLKSEGRVPLKELTTPGQEPDVNIGDEIEVESAEGDELEIYTKNFRNIALT